MRGRKVQPDGSRSYELLLEIGHGGMGTVHLARAVGMAGFERYVAIKICHPNLYADAEFAEMFLDEARIAARIRHPNVVATLDVGKADILFLVMEYVEGGRLASLIKAGVVKDQPIPVSVAARITVDVLTGLHAAHTLKDVRGVPLGIIHRDVTPHNIMVGVDGVSRILDFGIAHAAARATTTRDGHIKGKLAYMAPEQLVGIELTNRVDIYAAAVGLWEALTGKRMFGGKTDSETIAAVLRGSFDSLDQLRPDLPAAFRATVQRALATEPNARFETAEEFAAAIETSGVQVATNREVAMHVMSVFRESLEERNAELKALSDGVSGEVIAPAAGARVVESSLDEALTVRTKSHRGRIALALLVLLGGALVYWNARSTPRRDTVPGHALPAAAPGREVSAEETKPESPPVELAAPADAASAQAEVEPAPVSKRARRASAIRKRARSNAHDRNQTPPAAQPPAGKWWPNGP